MIERSINIRGALRQRQRGFILNPFRFGGGGGGDPNFANVGALLHFEGADGSTTFTDVTGKTWTASGNAQIDTGAFKWGAASGQFDGAGDYISSASSADHGFGSGDYTVEGWAIRSAMTGEKCIFDNRSASNQGVGIYMGATAGAYTNRMVVYNNTAVITGATVDLPVSTWFHWAVCRQGTTIRGYIDGVQRFSATDSRTYASSAAPFIGANYVGTQGFAGNVDDFRSTKGVCRYPNGTTFTPPTAAFPDS